MGLSRAKFDLMFCGLSPTARRIDGIRDARTRGIRLSNDPDYLSGYAWEEGRVRRKSWTRPVVRESLRPTGYPAVGSFHG